MPNFPTVVEGSYDTAHALDLTYRDVLSLVSNARECNWRRSGTDVVDVKTSDRCTGTEAHKQASLVMAASTGQFQVISFALSVTL